MTTRIDNWVDTRPAKDYTNFRELQGKLSGQRAEVDLNAYRSAYREIYLVREEVRTAVEGLQAALSSLESRVPSQGNAGLLFGWDRAIKKGNALEDSLLESYQALISHISRLLLDMESAYIGYVNQETSVTESLQRMGS